jgi:glycosyltransferase involved in cell wall biosynthesis
MENQPKISIIATFYNSVSLGNFVHKTMQSLLHQSYKNIEFIFVNDGSQDDTLLQLQEYQKKDDRIIIINKKNEGTAQYAKAAGQDIATGDYVMLFDHDDELSLDAIEKAVKILQNNPLLEMIGFIVKVCFADGKVRVIYNLDEKIKTVENYKNKIITGHNALQKTIGFYEFHFRGLYKNKVFKSHSFRFTEKLLNADEIVERQILENVKYIGNCDSVYTHYIFPNSSAKSFNLKKTDVVISDIHLRNYFKKLGIYNFRKQNFELSAYKNFIIGLKTLVFFRKKLNKEDLNFYLIRLKNSYKALDKKEILKNYSFLGKFYNAILLSLPFKMIYLFYQLKQIFNK